MRDGTLSGPLLFLSHAGADTGAARVLKQRIEGAPEARKRGLKVWFDKDNLRPGKPWQKQLEETIGQQATAFAVYVGSRGVINWVEAEVRLGLSRAIGGNGQHFPFIPVLAAGAVGSRHCPALPGSSRPCATSRRTRMSFKSWSRPCSGKPRRVRSRWRRSRSSASRRSTRPAATSFSAANAKHKSSSSASPPLTC